MDESSSASRSPQHAQFHIICSVSESSQKSLQSTVLDQYLCPIGFAAGQPAGQASAGQQILYCMDVEEFGARWPAVLHRLRKRFRGGLETNTCIDLTFTLSLSGDDVVVELEGVPLLEVGPASVIADPTAQDESEIGAAVTEAMRAHGLARWRDGGGIGLEWS